jgi:hypothetical protein
MTAGDGYVILEDCGCEFRIPFGETYTPVGDKVYIKQICFSDYTKIFTETADTIITIGKQEIDNK